MDTATIDTFAAAAAAETLGDNAAAAMASKSSEDAASPDSNATPRKGDGAGEETSANPSTAAHHEEGAGEETSDLDGADGQDTADQRISSDAAAQGEGRGTSGSGLVGGQRPGQRALLRLRKKCDAVFGEGGVGVVMKELGVAVGEGAVSEAVVAAMATC